MCFSCVISRLFVSYLFFFFYATATTEIYTLSLHDALPIFFDPATVSAFAQSVTTLERLQRLCLLTYAGAPARSEEHTSELQSHHDLVCRLLLEKKKHIPIQEYELRLDELNTDCVIVVSFYR